MTAISHLRRVVRTVGILLLLTLANATAVDSIEEGAPQIVWTGLQELQKNGTIAAINAWRVGSSKEADDDALDQASGRMNRVQAHYGRMLGFEVVRTVSLSPSTRRVYAVVKFEKGAAWMFFDCYKPQQEWIIPHFDFHYRASEILPPNILGGQ